MFAKPNTFIVVVANKVIRTFISIFKHHGLLKVVISRTDISHILTTTIIQYTRHFRCFVSCPNLIDSCFSIGNMSKSGTSISLLLSS